MIKFRPYWFFVFLAFTSCSTLVAMGVNGSRGSKHVVSAWNLNKGDLTLYTHTSFFGTVGHSDTDNNYAVTYWDVNGGLALNLGITDHIESEINVTLYQDNHHGDPGYNMPDDMYLKLKFGSYGLPGGTFRYGTQVTFRVPMAEQHNILFEPYSAGTLEFGVLGLFSYAFDPIYPEDGLNLNFNLGYLNHNDVGQLLNPADNSQVANMSQELTYGLSVHLPSGKFDFGVEVWGNIWLQQPPETAYSRESYLYTTPMVIYHPNRWLAFEVTGDVILSNAEKDETAVHLRPGASDIPNFANWRLNLGLRWTILPRSAYKVSEKEVLMRKAQRRRELFERIIHEQRETESAEEELEQIKAERRKAERELDRLRRILEGKEKPKEEATPEKAE